MPDVYTGVAALSTDQIAFDLYVYDALRPQLYFPQCADVRSTRQAHQGSAVTFTKNTDLSAATTTLVESVDVDAVALSDSQVTLTLEEKGNAVLTTAKLRGSAFNDVDKDAAERVGFNAGLSFDTLARTPLGAGTNVAYGGVATARNMVTPTSLMTAAKARLVRAYFVGQNAMPWVIGPETGSYYRGFMHPDVAVDFRTDTDAAGWRAPRTYSDPKDLWTGAIGTFEGVEYIETPRAEVLSDAGSSTTLTNVYKTVYVAKQALAMAYSSTVSGPEPTVVHGEVTDKLRRFKPVGWYWFGKFDLFRQESLYRVETASSIGANS